MRMFFCLIALLSLAVPVEACGGSARSTGLFGGRKHRIFPLFHRRHAGAAVSVGVGGGSSASIAIVPSQVTRLPVGATSSAAFSPRRHVRHPAGDGFPAGTGVVVSVGVKDGWNVYQVRCDQTGKILPGWFRESELSAISPQPATASPPPIKSSRAANSDCPACQAAVVVTAERIRRPMMMMQRS